jgi:hypothetical protein
MFASKVLGRAARRVVARDVGRGAGMEAAKAALALSSAVRLRILAASWLGMRLLDAAMAIATTGKTFYMHNA